MIGRPDFPHAAPPKLGMHFLGRLLPSAEREETIGDIEERFRIKVDEGGTAAARVWFWFQVLHLVSYIVKDHMIWSCIMFKNNLVIAWRNIKKSKLYSALNVLGLAVGMAVFILIMLFVRYELSYDRYHDNARKIYRIIQEQRNGLGINIYATTPGLLAPALIQEFAEIRAATRVKVSSDALIKVNNKIFFEKEFYWTDPQTFAIFSFQFVRGDGVTALKDLSSVLLSERMAHRYFGEADPIGQTIVYYSRANNIEFKIAGIFRDIPANSHFVMDIVAPFETRAQIHGIDLTEWDDSSYYTYVLLRDSADARGLEGKLPSLIREFAAKNAWSYKLQPSRYLLQPLTRIHLHSRANFEISPNGDSRLVLLFASIAVLFLTLASINYINLAIARSLKRIKEVGLRKVVGAAKGQLVRQFLGESMMITYLSLFLAVGIVLAGLPAFRAFVERDIVFNPIRDLSLILGLVLLGAAIGTIAGSYPAFFVSAFRPVSALKGTGTSSAKGRDIRNALIVLQFVASIALIICAVGVRGQLHLIKNMDMGYERDHIIVLSPSPWRGLRWTNIEAFKAELTQNPAVLSVAASSDLPNNVEGSTIASWPGKSDAIEIPILELRADYDFVNLYGLKLAQGRNFSRDYLSDSRGAFLINESARKALGWENPIGRELYYGAREGNARTIVGVFDDFHMLSLHFPIMPLYIFLDPNIARYVSIKIRGENIPQTLAFLRKTWERFEPNYPFEYSFFDEIFDRAYRAEQRLGTVVGVFAGLAILVACLGLVGLSSFTAERKTKEIGIRKVLGASSSSVVVLLAREFMKWVVLANLIAWPIAYYAMHSWLQNFASKTSLTVSMFLGAGLAAFAVAAMVVSLQTYRAAAANPVESIRYE